MAAESFTPLVERICEVLCDGALGVARSIRAGQFRRTTGRVAPNQQPPSAGDKPTIDVEIIATRDSEGTPGNESGDWWLVEADVVVSVTYAYLGGNALAVPNGGDRTSLTTRAANDGIRIRGALGYPGNLDRATGGGPEARGFETGLCSGLLEWRETESDWQDKTLVVRHRFLGRVELTPPT